MAKNKILVIVIVALIVIIGLGFALQSKFAKNQSDNNDQANNIPQKITVKIARSAVATSAFPLFVAQEKGFFSENGLEVQLETIQTSVSTQALLAKGVDYISFAKEAVTASLKDVPVKVIMAYGKNSGFAMATQPNLKISKIKKIVIATLLSPPHYTALKFIDDNKLSAEVVVAGENPGAASALLENKQVDAVIQSVISTIRIKNLGYTLLKTFDDEEMPQGLATTDEKIQNNPEEIKKVIKSIQSALEFIANNPGETKDLLLKFANLDKNDETDQKIIEEAYPVIKQTFTVGNVPSQDGINNLIKLGKAEVYKTFQDIAKQTVSEADIAKSFDFRFVTNN